MEHHDDPNFPAPVRAKIEYFLSGDASTLENYEMLLEEMKIGRSSQHLPILLGAELIVPSFSVEAGLIRFSSPYPEVRAVVSCTDDYNMPTSTFRVWVLGTICPLPVSLRSASRLSLTNAPTPVHQGAGSERSLTNTSRSVSPLLCSPLTRSNSSRETWCAKLAQIRCS